MQTLDKHRPVVTVILGAGASRDVSYARGGEGCSGGDMGPKMPSPLDSDFFDLLQQLEAQTKNTPAKEAMRRIIDKVLKWKGDSLWQSMEKMFYSLHLSEMLDHKLFAPESYRSLKELVNDFLLSIRALLNEAHGTRVCMRHCMLLQNLYFANDAVITFNYDFVVERVFADRHSVGPFKSRPFGEWFYGFSEPPSGPPNEVPTLYKLHGSLNWELKEDEDGEVQNARKAWPATWGEFAQELEYLPTPREGAADNTDENCRPPVLLPYWDKRVEKGLWLKIWKAAAAQLVHTDSLIVWGYSLPATDLKVREMIKLALRRTDKLSKVAVIDPSSETQDRWRSMFLDRQFWRFRDYEEFDRFLLRQGSNLAPFR